ncbi:MAG TPA: hypothetical protein ENK18_17090 [Deltaproteobacteria bacterium]|nr:hypothetical protein [Deltaproteobacteria bacterium]
MDPLTSATWGVILSAGGSRRMGSPKGLLEISGVPLLRLHLQRMAPACDRIGVVLGAHAERHRLVLGDTPVVLNPAWASTGPIDSLRLAVQRWGIEHTCLVTPVDVLPPSPTTLAALLAAGPPAVPTHLGQRGHPVLLGSSALRRVVGGGAPAGLRTILAQATEVEVADEAIAGDFDDPDAFRAALERWGRIVR